MRRGKKIGESMKNKKHNSVQKVKNTNGLAVSGIRPITNKDMKNRLLAFFMDVCVMLCPIAIWNIILLAVLGNLISITGITIITIVIGALLIISIIFMNSYVYQATGGQSAGMRMYGYKVVKKSGRPASKQQLMIRETIGFDIPFIVLMFFTNIFGILIYWMLNGIFVLADRKHRSIIDVLIGTRVVVIEKQVKENNAERETPQVMTPPVKPKKEPVRSVSSMDLHVHSNFSANGEFNVEEIFQIAKRKGIKTISITDLDCAKGNSIAVRMSELYDIKYVPGIEINCDLHGRRVRLLGYFIQFNSELYSHIENESLMNEKKASIDRVRKFEQVLGRSIDIERLLKNNRFQRVSGELIARHVLNRPEYSDCKILQPYLRGSKSEQPYREFSKDFFGYGKPCYVPVKYPLLKDVLDVIELTGGISVLAHPGKLLSQEPEIIEEAIDLGVQGIEVFHPMHTRKEMADLLQIASEHKLFITCGSGFYRSDSGIEIGVTTCPKEAETLVEMLMNAKM